MAPEKITVTISSSIGEDAPLTVNDAMRQILDFFALLESAGGEEASGIAWRLVEISMNSPLRATAEAVASRPGVVAEAVARREKAALSHSLDAMISGYPPPAWMDSSARERARCIFARNLNGIGRTDIQIADDGAPIIIVEKNARAAVHALEMFERQRADSVEDFSRSEVGSIEANVLESTIHRNRPAIKVRERSTGVEIPCVFASDQAESIGPQHSWAEIWARRRVLISGRIDYNKSGQISLVYVTDIEDVDPRPLKFSDIADPNFTDGLTMSNYLGTIWEDALG